MKISARNVFEGRITSVKEGPISAEVEIKLGTGATLSSIVTNSAIDDLGLSVGSPVTALFKAGSVVLGLSA